MNGRIVSITMCLAAYAIAGVAQTTVTTTNGGATGSVPVFTSNKNIENSTISQSNGKVGIGTTAHRLLEVGAGIPSSVDPTDISIAGLGALAAADSNGNGLFLNMTDSPFSGAGEIGVYNYATNTFIPLHINGSVIILSDPSRGGGYVGIATTAPGYPLDVNGKIHTADGIVFPDGTLQTTAYPASSSGGSAPIEVQNNEAVINTGVSATGSGIKHVRTNLACSTGSHIGDTCTIPVSWPGTPFADTNYTVTCMPKSVSGNWNSGNDNIVGYTLLIPDANKGPSAVNVVVENLQNSFYTTVTGLNCIAIHD
jgi:predicted RNA-binding protein with TRAM domain